MKDKQMFMEEFNNKLHRLGRITLVLSVVSNTGSPSEFANIIPFCAVVKRKLPFLV